MPEVGKLQEILNQAEAEAGWFYLLQGRGRVLAALPADPAGFSRTLALYRPQRILPQLWVRFLSLLPKGRVPGWLLRPWFWPGAPRPTNPCPGVLLGNPNHPVPRAIFLVQEGGEWRVGKFIPDPNQQDRLYREQDLLNIAASLGAHAPRCLGCRPYGQGGILWTEWVDSRPGNPSLEDRLGILHAWLLPKERRALRDFPAWQTTPPEAAPWAESASEIRLCPTLRHGDFAAWNLLQNPVGTWVAVDWEEGCAEDAPGLDLVHDLLQQEFLIRRAPFARARARILQALHSPLIARYLEACGWLGQEAFLLDWTVFFEAQARPEIKHWIHSR